MISAVAPVRRAIPWRQVIRQATGMWLVTRLIFVILTYAYAAYFVPTNATLHTLVESWHKWDAVWYVAIAQRGYWYFQPTAFFPLYPTLIKIVSLALGGHAVAAALLVSNLAAWPAFVGLGALTANERWAARASWRTIQVAAAYPFALFLFAPYTESLFLAFAVFCLFHARRGSWRWAAVCALMATLARPTGVVLVAPLLWEYGRQRGWWLWLRAQVLPLWAWGTRRLPAPRRLRTNPVAETTTSESGAEATNTQTPGPMSWLAYGRSQARAVLDALLVCGTVPAVLVLFALYCWINFGHPLLFLNVHQLYWSRVSKPIWLTLASTVHNFVALPLGDPDQATILFDLCAVLVCALVTLATIRRVPVTFTLYTAGVLYMAISTPVLTSPAMIQGAGRFLLVAFPVFMVMGRSLEKRPWLELLVIGGGFLLQALFATLFLSHVLIE